MLIYDLNEFYGMKTGIYTCLTSSKADGNKTKRRTADMMIRSNSGGLQWLLKKVP